MHGSFRRYILDVKCKICSETGKQLCSTVFPAPEMSLFFQISRLRKRLGLSTHDLLYVGVFLFLTLIGLCGLIVYLLISPTLGIVFAVGTLLECWRRFSRWPGFGTPSLPKLTSSAKVPKVRVVAMSDTHNTLTKKMINDLPEADVFIHCGDMTNDGSEGELRCFNQWLGNLRSKYRFVVVVCGNHDLLCDAETYSANRARLEFVLKGSDAAATLPARDVLRNRDQVRGELLSNATHVLFDETVVLKFDDGRSISVHGSPRTRRHEGSAMSAFAHTEAELAEIYRKTCTEKVDVLVTHGPPKGILDRAFFGVDLGSEALANHLTQLQLRRCEPLFHVFGHVHEGYGVARDVKLGSSSSIGTTFINAASVNLFHTLRNGNGSAVAFDVVV